MYFAASISALTTPLGSCLMSVTVDRFGRKRNLLLIQVWCAVTWTATSAVSGEYTLYASAVLCGLSRGGKWTADATRHRIVKYGINEK